MNPELILVIEDDAAILFGLRDNLQRAGYAVRSASDGHLGLELVRTLRPDLVLLDLMLPGLSGHEVCRRIRDDGLEMPVVMLTALGEEAQVVRGLNLGADDYVTKPFGIGELMARVAALLRRRRRSTPDVSLLARSKWIGVRGASPAVVWCWSSPPKNTDCSNFSLARLGAH